MLAPFDSGRRQEGEALYYLYLTHQCPILSHSIPYTDLLLEAKKYSVL